jgi:uncharacterized alpha-E superfamily protein
MLSRAADRFGWMSRCLERQSIPRAAIDVDLQLGLGPSTWLATWLARQRWWPWFDAEQVPKSVSVTHTLLLDSLNPSSIFGCVAAARDNLGHAVRRCARTRRESREGRSY